MDKVTTLQALTLKYVAQNAEGRQSNYVELITEALKKHAVEMHYQLSDDLVNLVAHYHVIALWQDDEHYPALGGNWLQVDMPKLMAAGYSESDCRAAIIAIREQAYTFGKKRTAGISCVLKQVLLETADVE